MLQEFISSLGMSVEARWQREHYNSEALLEIAVEELQRADIHTKLSYDDVLRHIVTTATVQQSYDRFSDLAQTVWRGPHFYIELLLWLHSTTSRHQHGFCGAFQVIHGASCHSTFHFTPSERLNDRMEIGGINWGSSEILRQGDIQTIPGGESYIHSLFHLREPSMTLVLRTYQLPSCQPQWNYYAPSIRVDPFIEVGGLDYTLKKKKKAVEVGWQCNIELGDELTHMWLESCDIETAFRFLLDAARPQSNEETEAWRASVHQQLAKRWPDLWPACQAAIEGEMRNLDIARRRTKVFDPDQRFILAILMNVPDRQTILDLVQAELECDDPHAAIAEHLYDMGVDGCGIDMKRTSAEILALATSGLDLMAVNTALRDKYGAESIDEHAELIKRNYHAFKKARLLQGLFT